MRTLLKFLAALAFGTGVASANVSIFLTAGVLANGSGLPIADGSLIQLISNGSNASFSAPSSASFVTGGNILVASFALNSFVTEQAGTLTQDLTGITSIALTGGLNAGQKLAIRWFPTLTTGSSTPGAGTGYGEYTENSNEFVLPGDGNSIGPTFATLAFGGESSELLGRASLTIAGSAIPEPATYALLVGLAALGLTGWRRRRGA
jgi:hypothetical protein